tara:strand:- start:221 stop:409 length:189 start_codon:yes stop_codon:yes gene_type:complete
MSSFINISDLKTFSLGDLSGRTVSIRWFSDESEAIRLLMAFDIHTNESFVIKAENFPINKGE